jgi:uncharacterized protein YegL
MATLEESVEFAENADPRCPCVLVLDTSGSMDGRPISLLNDGLKAFADDLQTDELARRRVEVAIVTFGGRVDVRQQFITADGFQPPILSADGATPMGAAIQKAVMLVRERKQTYKENGVAYYRPWIFMVTDGEPTDDYERAKRDVHDEERSGGLAFFAVGVEEANMSVLAEIAVRPPVKLKGLSFQEMFVWLSQSQKRVSASKPGEQTALPAASGWQTV